MIARVVRNDWSVLSVPELGAWRPSLSVSVVMPAYNGQPQLDLALAALSRQTYPAELLEVVVVDDGSSPDLELPKIRPANCRMVRVSDGWGIANACNVGARHASGEVILRLDSDIVVFPDHVEAHARWHHEVPYAVTLGEKRFVDVAPDDDRWPSPEMVAARADEAAMGSLFDLAETEPHGYIEEHIGRTDALRRADHLVFQAHVGATVAVRRELFEAAGGYDGTLRRGSDTEFGYRLAQAGAVFVPETQARSWHLGRSGVMHDEAEIQRYSRPFLADRMPQPRWLRKVGGTAWAVPLVTVVVDVAGRPLELVRAAVDAILASDETDLRVLLVGDWDSIGDERGPLLIDPLLDLRLVAATYRSDPRVRLVTAPPDTAFPSPYLLTVPVFCGLSRAAISRLVEVADQSQAGVVRVPSRGGGGEPTEMWRTAALGRAGWVRKRAEKLVDVVTEVYGSRTLSADAIGVVDLSRFEPAQLAAGIGLAGEQVRPGRWLPSAVEVAGARSLGRAAILVGRLSAVRVWDRVWRSVAWRGRRSVVVRGRGRRPRKDDHGG